MPRPLQWLPGPVRRCAQPHLGPGQRPDRAATSNACLPKGHCIGQMTRERGSHGNRKAFGITATVCPSLQKYRPPVLGKKYASRLPKSLARLLRSFRQIGAPAWPGPLRTTRHALGVHLYSLRVFAAPRGPWRAAAMCRRHGTPRKARQDLRSEQGRSIPIARWHPSRAAPTHRLKMRFGSSEKSFCRPIVNFPQVL